jgi:ElaB/YqjD/DUF883 family membrane-anchored ribosome-binding protein
VNPISFNQNPRSSHPVEAARSASHELGHATADGMRQMADVASREAAHVGEAARDWWRVQKNAAAEAADAVQTRAAALNERSISFVREQPMKSVLGALALGALIAAIFSSRRGR